MSRMRDQWMGALALFLVLTGGVAWAASALTENSVKSKHIVDGQVKNVDLASDAVTSSKVADGSLASEDFAAGQLPQGQQGPQGVQGPQGATGARGATGLQGPAGPSTGPAGGDLAGSYPNPTIAGNAVGSSEVINSSLTAADLDETALANTTNTAFAPDGSCNPNSTTFVTCKSLTLDVVDNSEGTDTVLVIGTVQWFDDSGNSAKGECRFNVANVSTAASTQMGENTDTTAPGYLHQTTLMTVVGGVNANLQVKLECNESDDDIAFTNVDVAAIGDVG